MSLAARLDRLRAAAGRPVVDGIDRLPSTSDVVGAGERLPTGTDGLARDLGMERLGEALLCRRVEVRLEGGIYTPTAMTTLPEVCDLETADWLYVDTETTGLSGGVGNLAFMVGAARLRDPRTLELRQYLLAGFAAERRMLQAFSNWVGPRAVLVSYNGKCFDLPLLLARCRIHRVDHALAGLRHLDLMYGVRRAFRRSWPDCRLQTAERRLLGLQRVDDMPGAAAPAAWQAWLRNGSSEGLAGVLRHNHQDVVSLALLHRRLATIYDGGAPAAADIPAIGRAWCMAGEEVRARRLMARAAGTLDEDGQLQLAALHRRAGDWDRAEAVWRSLSASGSRRAASELSKYYEHRRRDYHRALAYAYRCDDVEREVRRARLQRKLGGNLCLPFVDGVNP